MSDERLKSETTNSILPSEKELSIFLFSSLLKFEMLEANLLIHRKPNFTKHNNKSILKLFNKHQTVILKNCANTIIKIQYVTLFFVYKNFTHPNNVFLSNYFSIKFLTKKYNFEKVKGRK